MNGSPPSDLVPAQLAKTATIECHTSRTSPQAGTACKLRYSEEHIIEAYNTATMFHLLYSGASALSVARVLVNCE